MQVYNSFGPNPRALRMFLAEKGLTVPMQDVDLMAAENRKPPYTERNQGDNCRRSNSTTARPSARPSPSSTISKRNIPSPRSSARRPRSAPRRASGSAASS